MIEQLRAGEVREFKTVHFCGGIGGCSLGMQQSELEYRGITGRFRTLFSLDVDPGACEAYRKITGSKAVCDDMFDREQYILFHGREPEEDWQEVTAEDLREWAGGEYPDVIFISAPCKGFSRLLPNAAAQKPKYKALNKLALRAMTMAMDAWGDNPPAVILFENVPGIETRGAEMLAQVKTILGMYGYVFHEGHHDCGEIGNLGQRRVRYLMIARQPKKLPSFIYQPPKLGHRTIGDVLGPLPLPGDMEHGGKMHRIPQLAWKTWERLALIPAGKDWRALKDLNHSPHNGAYLVAPWDAAGPAVCANTRVGHAGSVTSVSDPRIQGHDGKLPNAYQVQQWDKPARTVTGQTDIQTGALSVADVRMQNSNRFGSNLKVSEWDKAAPTITGARLDSGSVVVADERTKHYNNILKVCDWNEPGAAITGGSGVMSGGLTVNDPRNQWSRYKVVRWEGTAPAVVGQSNVKGSAASVGDPRISEKWSGAGNFKVMLWDQPSNAMTSSADVHAGAAAVADPRIPGPDERGVWIIVALDGTWHRPITTFEMAMLQGFPQLLEGKPFELPGNSDAKWREWIGNAVPVQAATAMGNALLSTMLPNYVGDWHWDIDGNDVWVREQTGTERRIMHNTN